MLIRHLVSRADDETLQLLLGEQGMRLIMALDPSLASPIKLKEIVVNLHSPAGLLLSKKNRALFLEFLRPKEMENLAQVLGLKKGLEFNQYLEQLQRMNIIRGSERERALLDFFEVDIPPIEDKKIVETIESEAPYHSLFPYQRTAACKVILYLYQDPRKVLLHMPTGSGKTRTAMSIIADHFRSHEPTVIIWLAYSEEICEQAASEFLETWKHLGNREIKLFRFWGSHHIDPEDIVDGLVVAGLSKIFSATKQSIQFIRQLGVQSSLIIIDEAHTAIAETYQLIIDALMVSRPSTSLLGLTATPGRTWDDIGEDEKLSRYFAKRKVSLEVEGHDNPIDYLISEGYLAHTKFHQLFSEGGFQLSERDLVKIKNSLDIPDEILRHLAKNEQRSLKIILEIERLAKHHKRILVFATTIEHSDLLASILQSRGYDAHSVTGNTSSFDRKRIIDSFRDNSEETKIICNFGVLTTGFDAPRTSATVIARPTKSLVLYSQMVGRVIRGLKAGGNNEAEIVTVVDQELPGFRSMSEAFSNWEDVWRKS